MLLILFTSILSNLIIRSFQCDLYDRKKYNRINNPNLGTPLHRQNENYWIRELGTATPYGCNDKIDGIHLHLHLLEYCEGPSNGINSQEN